MNEVLQVKMTEYFYLNRGRSIGKPVLLESMGFSEKEAETALKTLISKQLVRETIEEGNIMYTYVEPQFLSG